MDKLIFALLTFLCCIGVDAQDFEVDGNMYSVADGESKTVEIVRNTSKYSGDVVIPSAVTYNNTTYKVTGIGEGAFSGCDGLKSIDIPSSVTSIEDGAFMFCSGLTSITIPNSVTSIELHTFSL